MGRYYRFEDAEVVHATPKAILVEVEGEELWVPKSVIHDDSEVYGQTAPGPGDLLVKEWWAAERGFC